MVASWVASWINSIESAAFAPAQFLVAGVWQGLLLAAIAWIGLKAFPGLSARNRFVLWMNVFVLAALIPLFSVFPAPALASRTLVSSIAGRAVIPLSASAAASFPVHRLPGGWAEGLVGLWLGASLLSFGRLFSSGYSVWRLSRTATPLPAEALNPDLQSLLHSIPVKLSPRVDSPAAIGFFRPAIVIPEWLAARLTQPEMRQVLLHELAHLKRRDDWTNLLQQVLRALLPLNPALILAGRQLSREREMACDDAVLDAAVAPHAYATCLAALAERRISRRAQPLAPGAWRRRSELAARVHRILAANPKLGGLGAKPAVAIFLPAFLLAGVSLARCPQLVAFTAAGVSSPVSLNAPAESARISPPVFETPSPGAVSSPGEQARISRAAAHEASFEVPPSVRPYPMERPISRRRGKHRAQPGRHETIDFSQAMFSYRTINGLTTNVSTEDTVSSPAILALWEPSPAPVWLSAGGFSFLTIAIFESRTSWIVIQL